MPKRYFLALLLVLAGCAASHPPRLQVAAGYCDPPLPYRYNPAFAPQADFEAALTPALLARYPAPQPAHGQCRRHSARSCKRC